MFEFPIHIAWQDPGVQSALISGSLSLISTIIATICAAVIGKKFADRKKLEADIQVAFGDIAFLLEVERRHCEMHRTDKQATFKRSVRSEAQTEGFSWSGKFTPGRTRARARGEHFGHAS